MISRARAVSIVAAFFLVSAESRADLLLGKVDNLHRIQAVALCLPDKTKLDLGYHTTSYYCLLGVGIGYKGYVLMPKETKNICYAMPSGQTLIDFQKTGMLPNPLPVFRLPWWRVLWRYSLWWLLALALAIWLGIYRWKASTPAAQGDISPAGVEDFAELCKNVVFVTSPDPSFFNVKSAQWLQRGACGLCGHGLPEKQIHYRLVGRHSTKKQYRPHIGYTECETTFVSQAAYVPVCKNCTRMYAHWSKRALVCSYLFLAAIPAILIVWPILYVRCAMLRNDLITVGLVLCGVGMVASFIVAAFIDSAKFFSSKVVRLDSLYPDLGQVSNEPLPPDLVLNEKGISEEFKV